MRGNNDNNSLIGKYSTKDSLKKSTLTFWDENEIERDITYRKILEDLQDLSYNHYINEFEYRFNDGENINDILISIITRNIETKSTIGYHKETIQSYLNQDFMKLFD